MAYTYVFIDDIKTLRIIGLTSTASTIRNIEDLTQTSFLVYQIQNVFCSLNYIIQIDAHCYIITSDIIITD